MKKLLTGTFILVWLLNLVWFTFASSDCKEVDFGDGTVCISIEKISNTKFKLVTDINSVDWPIRCNISLPGYNNGSNWFLAWSNWSDCNQTFTYDYNKYNNDEWTLKIYVKANEEYPTDWEDKPNNGSQRAFPQWEYSFIDTEWVNSTNHKNKSSSNGDLDSFNIALSDSTPDTYDKVTLTIKAYDGDDTTMTDYDGSNADISVQYRTSSSSSWKTAPSTYYSIDDKTPSFYNWKATTYITFKKDYDFKIIVTDDNENIDSNKIFYIWNSYNSSSNSSYSSSYWFSSSEMSTIEELYNRRPWMINDLEDQYSSLRNNSTRKNKSDLFYGDISDIIDSRYNGTYQDYDEFQRWFEDRYTYTNRIK